MSQPRSCSRTRFFPPAYWIGRLFFSAVVADSAALEEIVRHSGLDWTLVRPPRLNEGPRTQRYRVRVGQLPGLGFAISRADVADLMLKTLDDPASIAQIIGVAN